jgi:N-acetylneuraminic acid mutarotase
MNPPIFERARAVIAISLLLQSLLGCAAAEGIPQSPWARAAPMPTSRSELAAAALAGRIYVAGGIAQWGTTAAFEAYDPATDRWEELEGRLYVVGGVGPASEEIWVYDPAMDSWEAAPAPLPTQREHLAVTVLDGKLYAVGGRWGDAGNLAALEIYDPAAGTWTRGPDLPTPRSGLTASVLKGRIHVVGGESLSLTRTFGEHEAYDPSSKAWSTLADLPTPRHGLASAAVGGRWYVIGGGAKAGALTFISLTDLVEVFPGGSE